MSSIIRNVFLFLIKDYRHTIVLRAQFAAGGHFVLRHEKIFLQSHNKAILYECSIILFDFHIDIEAKKIFFYIFLVFQDIKRNVNNKKFP
jgi:hypothetical protein